MNPTTVNGKTGEDTSLAKGYPDLSDEERKAIAQCIVEIIRVLVPDLRIRARGRTLTASDAGRGRTA